jgi:fructose-bisphosphate aldolase class II
MTLATLRDVMADGGAIAAFNVVSLEHAEAVVDGATRHQSPVVLQISENVIRYHRALLPIVAACSEVARRAGVPVALHLDHLENDDLVDEVLAVADRFGIGSLMYDGSRFDYDANVAATARHTQRAHDAGLWLEAELGAIGGKDGAHAPGVRTVPAEAASFVAATGVDALAVAVGSSHAMATRSAELDIDLIEALAAAVPVPLVLHGSSGVPAAAIADAIRAGIRKVNIGTAVLAAWTTALRTSLDADPDVVDPRRYTRESREAVARLVEAECAVVAAAR